MKTSVNSETVVLRNGEQTATFVQSECGYRPEWFRLGERPMLRFKDHEWLVIGVNRVTDGQLYELSETSALFAGQVQLGGTPVDWTVRVSVPEDGGPGFTVSTAFNPIYEPVEVLEALTTFETPYEYDGSENITTVIAQQPVYKYEGGKEISGSGYVTPTWYYAHKGRAHLTYLCATPLIINQMVDADGGNSRWTMIMGNWDISDIKDIFAQPTRNLNERDKEISPTALTGVGKHGMKFLVGTVNWNASLVKDPNVLIEAGEGLSQEVTVDFSSELPNGTLDDWLASGWERMVKVHMPDDGIIPAYEVAKSVNASWTNAAKWLAEQFQKPEGYPGFYHPERGVSVYSPGTRPKWDHGVKQFCGQWMGPIAYLGYLWGDEGVARAAEHLEDLFREDLNPEHSARHMWTIGPTPQVCGALRMANLVGLKPETLEAVRQYVTMRADFVLNPPAGARKGDAGIMVWDAFCNLLAAEQFDKEGRIAAACELLARANGKLDGDFWQFNCAAEGDLVGAGQARPFGHAFGLAANALAWQYTNDAKYLEAAQRFGNLLLGMHYHVSNESPSCDLDTRGWAHGSTGGRDQWAQIPPWETSYSLQQFAYLMNAGKARQGIYDVLWYFSHTGLAMFPAARILKRLYKPDMTITYKPIHELATEREFYLSLPYLAYECPWDQTMLAGYQGVEPPILSLFLGGGLVKAEDERVVAFVPAASTFDKAVAKEFTAEVWNPLDFPIETRLSATIASYWDGDLKYSGPVSGVVNGKQPATEPMVIPPRDVVKVTFKR